MKIQLQKGPVSHYKTQTVTTSITVKQLHSSFKVDVYDPKKGRMGEAGGYQRKAVEKRVKKLVERLTNPEKAIVVATAILVNVRNPKEKLNFNSKGIAEVDMPEEILIKDGFHRVSAWVEVYENADDYGLDQEKIGNQLVNVVMYWGADLVEEVHTFYDVNRNAKSIPTGNTLEMNAYLTKYSDKHEGDELLAEIDDLIYELAEIKQWKDKIQWPNEPANVCPSSSLVRSAYEIFGKDVFTGLKYKDKLSLLTIVWEAIEIVFPEIFSADKKKYSLQKAIGVTVVHRLVVKIYTDILIKNNNTFDPKDRIEINDIDVWVSYLMKMRDFEGLSIEGEPVDGIKFWLSGKEGGAGQYSSGAGRNTVSNLFINLVLDK